MRDVVCRNSSCTTLTSSPFALRMEEKVWRKVCHEIFLVIPSFRAAGWMISLITAQPDRLLSASSPRPVRCGSPHIIGWLLIRSDSVPDQEVASDAGVDRHQLAAMP